MKHDKAPQRLDFLRLFLKSNNITQTMLASSVGRTRMSVCNWLHNDDVRLSLLRQFFQAFGYEFEIHLTKTPYVASDPVVFMNAMARDYERQRLPFLCEAMAKYDISKTEMANKLGLNLTTIRHMFLVNDMNLSRVFDFAYAFHLSIVFCLRPQQAEEDIEDCSPIIMDHPLSAYSANLPLLVADLAGCRVVTFYHFAGS